MRPSPPAGRPHFALFEERAPWQERLRVGAFLPFSTVDWPGVIAGVVFLQGCPWRCGYCHNPELQRRDCEPQLSWAYVEEKLLERRDWLDGVVFTGGEPTTDGALPGALRTTRDMGFKTGLHTGGGYPERLREMLPLLDWVGFDIKADAATYDAITGVKGSGGRAMQSLRHVVDSQVHAEFRMTYHSALLSDDAVLRAADSLAALGVRNFVLQEFRPTGVSKVLPRHSGISASLVHELTSRFPELELRPHQAA